MDIIGTANNDILTGTKENDIINGLGGNDSIRGLEGDDTLNGGDDNDSLLGEAGNDIINPGLGQDDVSGGDGNDVLVVDYSQIGTGAGNQGIRYERFGLGSNGYSGLLYAFKNNNYNRVNFNQIERFNITGTQLDDVISGGKGDDVLIGEKGNDTLISNGGKDIVDGGEGVDALDSLNFADSTEDIVVEADVKFVTNGVKVSNVERFTNLVTGSGNDIIKLTGEYNDSVNAGSGDDIVNPGLGQDDVGGGDGNDVLVVDYSQIGTGTGNQGIRYNSFGLGPNGYLGELYAFKNNNYNRLNFNQIERFNITGTQLDDVISGGKGDDVLIGEKGNDTLISNGGKDIVDGGEGVDALDSLNFADSIESIVVEADVNFVTNGVQVSNVERFTNLVTGSGNDIIKLTGEYNDSVNTGSGDDILNPGLGQDDVSGGDGNDVLVVDYSQIGTGAGNQGIRYERFEVDSNGYFAQLYAFKNNNYNRLNFNQIERFNITGTQSDDVISGGNSDDVLIGSGGNDTISSDAGNDIIIGVNPYSNTPGLNEIDTLTGGTGSDTFILGNTTNVFYDDGNVTTVGTGDYARIVDFNKDEDFIQLKGSKTNYRLANAPTVPSGTAIYLKKSNTESDELIAVIQGVFGLDLNSNTFIEAKDEVSFGAANFTVIESSNSKQAAITLTRTVGSRGETSATILLNDGTANAPSDYDNTQIEVKFADKETSKTVFIPIKDDGKYEGNETVNLSLVNPTNGATLGNQNTATLRIIDNDPPVPGNIEFGGREFRVNEDGTPVFAVTVVRTGGSDGDVSATIILSDGSATAPIDYDNTAIVVNFANGESSKIVTIPVVNDTVLEANETINLVLTNATNGAAIGLQNATVLQIVDDDIELNFNATSYTVREDGTAVTNIVVTRTGNSKPVVGGTITFTDGTAKGCSCGPNSVNNDFHNGVINFTLAENEMSKIIPVESATLGNSNAIRIRNDSKYEGNETFTINLKNPTGGVTIGNQNGATITILDDDPAPFGILAFEKTDFAVSEDGTPIAAVTIIRTNGSQGEVSANLLLSNGTAIAPEDYNATPILVKFNDGETRKVITVPIVDDKFKESNETINLSLINPTGGATLGTQAQATLTIVDNDNSDFPDLIVSKLIPPEAALTNTTANITYRVENQNVTNASGNWVDRVYLSSDDQVGNDQLLGEFSFTGNLPPSSYEREIPFTTPKTPGKYWLIATTDATNTISEGTQAAEQNNTTITPFIVNPAYRATVSTDTEIGIAGTNVIFRGQALSNLDNTPVPFQFVTVGIQKDGTRRELQAFTDKNGNFVTNFIPLPGEAGKYDVNAYFPRFSGEDVVPEDKFTLLGMRLSTNQVSYKTLVNKPITDTIELQNLSDISLNNITATIEGAPTNWNIKVDVPQTLAGSSKNQITYTITAPNTSVLQDDFRIKLTSAEGASAILPVNVSVTSLAPRLVTNLSELRGAMLRNNQTPVEFTVTNEGGIATGDVQVRLPDTPWLKLASPQTISSLAPGESSKVTLLLTPDANLPLNIYEGNIALDAPGSAADVSLPFNFRAISEAVGNLRVKAVNELFYFTKEAPTLANATVILRDAISGDTIRTAITDSTGIINFNNLAEGYYTLEVKAKAHDSFKKSVFVNAGQTEDIQSFLSRQTVKYNWIVRETEIQDQYNISVESVFETDVPIPTVVIDPPLIDLVDLDVVGEIKQFDLKVTNHGLIAANDIKLNFGEHPFYKIEPLINQVDVLAAKSSLIIPILITRISDFENNSNEGNGRFAFTATSSSVSCSISAGLDYTYECGGEEIKRAIPLPFVNVSGNCGGKLIELISRWGDIGGKGGIGGLGGNVRQVPVEVVPYNPSCDPCNEKIKQAILECAIDIAFFLAPPIISCSKAILDLLTGLGDSDNDLVDKLLDGLSAAVGCAPYVNKLVPKGLVPGKASTNENMSDSGNNSGGSNSMGTLLDIIKCLKALFSACSINGNNNIQSISLAQASIESEWLSSFNFPLTSTSAIDANIKQLEIYSERLQNILDANTILFGDVVWFEGNDGKILDDWVNVFLTKAQKDINGGAKISASERDELLNLSLPLKVTGADVNKFIDRWNRSIDYWEAGIYNLADVPNGQSTDFLAIDVWRNTVSKAYTAITLSEAEGFSDITDAIREEIKELQSNLESSSGGVCAKVRIRIDQDAVMTRSAFLGTLEIDNENDVIGLQDISVDIDILDSNGRVVDELFGIPNPVLSGLNAVDGTGRLNPNSSGSAEFTIIPTINAAPEGATRYSIGGTLSYTEDGKRVTVPLLSTGVTVLPQAQLRLDYFQQRDVFGDDPFTKDIVETSEPFSLGVLVTNEGKGVASNLKITSGQPKIIENEKELLVNFEIIGTQIGGQSVTPSLTANFGNIEPGKAVVADWLLKSSLQGKFTEYKATFEHVNSLGKSELSLIKSVNIHELIRKVQTSRTGDDQLPDFLVNNVPDAKFLPDTLYLSDGTKASVSTITNITTDGVVTDSDLEVQVSTTNTNGWSYLKLSDPGNGKYQIARVLRSDGAEVLLKNVWQTDRTFPEKGRPVYENMLHLLDYNSTGSYIITYRSVINTNPINKILGTPGRDVLTGTETQDIIIGFQSRDILTGNGGNDQFVYTNIRDGGDLITDFKLGEDKIVLTEILENIGYRGSDPLADGFVKSSSLGTDSLLQIDIDGFGSQRPTTLATIQNVTANQLNQANNFIF